jgi:uncharacterized lipoprotein YajG
LVRISYIYYNNRKKINYYIKTKKTIMKKIVALVSILALASCGGSTSTEVKTDSTAVVADSAKADTAAVVADTVAVEKK